MNPRGKRPAGAAEAHPEFTRSKADLRKRPAGLIPQDVRIRVAQLLATEGRAANCRGIREPAPAHCCLQAVDLSIEDIEHHTSQSGTGKPAACEELEGTPVGMVFGRLAVHGVALLTPTTMFGGGSLAEAHTNTQHANRQPSDQFQKRHLPYRWGV